MKTYATKSNARRAAKAANIVDFEIVEVDGRFTYQETPVVDQFVNCPHCDVHLSNGYTTHDHEVADGKKGLDTHEIMCLACGGEFGDEIVRVKKPVKAPGTKSSIEMVDKSTIERPTKYVWHVADEMFNTAQEQGDDQPRRKEVIEECVRRGVAYNTARTQYQQWWQCRNGNLK